MLLIFGKEDIFERTSKSYKICAVFCIGRSYRINFLCSTGFFYRLAILAQISDCTDTLGALEFYIEPGIYFQIR